MPTELRAELDKRGIPHIVDWKKSREKARLVVRLLLDDEGVFPGTPMYDKLLPTLVDGFGRRYPDMRSWGCRKYRVSTIGLPYDNREPLARNIVRKILQDLGESSATGHVDKGAGVKSEMA